MECGLDVCEDGLKSVRRVELEEEGRAPSGHLFHDPGVNAVVAVDVLQGPFDLKCVWSRWWLRVAADHEGH